MRAVYMGLGAIALATVNAWEYPYCEHDGCYRNLIDERFKEEAEAWCPTFLSGTTTAASAIPTNFDNCHNDVAAVSSACSCITYVPTTSVPSSTVAPPTSTPTSHAETSSAKPSSVSSAKPTSYTTSTITTTHVYTVTKCPPTVTKCPVGEVTSEVIVTTTVCPVDEIPPHTLTSLKPTSKPPVGTGSYTPTPTSSRLVPTAAAGRVGAGLGGVAAAAGFLAALL